MAAQLGQPTTPSRSPVAVAARGSGIQGFSTVAVRSSVHTSPVPEGRRASADAQRETLARLYAAHITVGPNGPELSQPLRLWRLRAAKL